MNKILLNKSEMFEKYCPDKEHALEVEKYSIMLFEAMNGIVFDLTEKEKEYLCTAAKLHDIGYYVDKKSHHKHTLDIILKEGLADYSEEGTLVVANIARYHRNSLPDVSRHEAYAKLTDDAKELVNKLASLLRIADGLDKPHKNLILRMRAEKTEDCVNLYIKTIGFKPSLKAAEHKKDLFELTFAARLNFIIE